LDAQATYKTDTRSSTELGPMFRDKAMDELFEKQGYVVLQMLSQDDLQHIDELAKQQVAGKELDENFFYYSLMDNSYEQNVELAQQLKAVLLNAFKQHFTGSRLINPSFLIKTGRSSDMALHQDWSNVAPGNRSCTLWCPLMDVDEQTGAIFLIRGSHKYFDNYRSGVYPTGRLSSPELSEYYTPVKMKRGEVLFFHPALWHGSYPNLSNKQRVVLGAQILQQAAAFTYYHSSQLGVAQEYQLHDEAIFRELKTLSIGQAPLSGQVVRSFAYEHSIVTAEELVNKIQQEAV
jgi:hypothetical protein